jgi:hypothetical protein
MYVRPSGAVLIVGHLGDGAAFSTSSIITSGSSVPVYANLYNSTGGLLAGTLNFQDVPSVSDCAGTLFWSRPAIKSVSPYSAGFETSTQFTAAQFNPFISNLNDDDVSFVASGADLLAESSTSVTLHFLGGFLPSYQGGTANVRLMVGAIGDAFMGSFKDPVTNKMDPFVGVLLPKSRTGAGLFFSDGLSGSVNINY